MSKRSYRQYCSLARALDAVGDRWSMLIVRNLLLGPQRWGELREGLPAIAKNLLASRLSDLEEVSIVTHEGQLYRLTERGRELQPALFALATWGEKHLMGPPEEDEAIRLRYLMTSVGRKLETYFSGLGPGAPLPDKRLLLWVDDMAFGITMGANAGVVQGSGIGEPHATVRCGFSGLRKLLFEGADMAQLIESAELMLEGDGATLSMLVEGFSAGGPRPEPAPESVQP